MAAIVTINVTQDHIDRAGLHSNVHHPIRYAVKEQLCEPCKQAYPDGARSYPDVSRFHIGVVEIADGNVILFQRDIWSPERGTTFWGIPVPKVALDWRKNAYRDPKRYVPFSFEIDVDYTLTHRPHRGKNLAKALGIEVL
jgi:hypothetical protein